MDKQQNEDDNTEVKQCIEMIRKHCFRKGVSGIKRLGTIFLQLDKDYSKTINFEEFSEGLKAFGLVSMSDEDAKTLFSYFDKDSSGSIGFGEFLEELRPPMSQPRIRVINEAFDALDTTKDGVLKVEDLQGTCYSDRAKNHPKYIKGEWSETEVLQNFLQAFDSAGQQDGVITREEFINYYASVSSTIDDDCYFDMVMRKCWQLPQRSKSTDDLLSA